MPIQGGKNIFNHVAAVSLLGADGFSLILSNAPAISDRDTVAELLASLGIHVSGGETMRLDGGPLHTAFPPGPATRLRVSICYGVALAARLGSCEMPLPGGDAFVARPIDLHIRAALAAGADVEIRDRRLAIRFSRPPSPFQTDVAGSHGPSMGATVSAMLLAAVADGVSRISSASQEPEVIAVMEVLGELGVGFKRSGTDVDVVGLGKPLVGQASHHVAGDRIEAATFMLIAAARRRDIRLHGLHPSLMGGGLRATFESLGIRVEHESSGHTLVKAASRADRGTIVTTGVHPGFPSDAQPQIAAYLALLSGRSEVHERVYAHRLTHVPELAKIGVEIKVDSHVQIMHGRQVPRGGAATVADIRCGAALLLAASATDRRTVINDPQRHLSRGYSGLVSKLRFLGVPAEIDAEHTLTIGQ